MPERLTRRQAAEQLGVSLGRVDVYLRTGLLTRHKNVVTRAVTLDAAEVAELARKRKGEQ